MGTVRCTIAAVGDISFRGDPGSSIDRHGPAYPFELLTPVLESADVRFGNMESVLVPESFPREELAQRALCSSDTHAEALACAGFDVLNMASNHVLDCGTIGLENTRRAIETLGIRPFGAGLDPDSARRPAVMEACGLRIGFLGYQEDCNYTFGHVGAGPAYLVEEDIVRDMTALREHVDVVVLSLHADLEFMETPAPWRRDLSRRLARAGADLILEHHPHVPQGVERVDRSLIAYSLGNCVFDAHLNPYMRDNGPHTAHSFVLNVELSKDGAGEFSRIPFDIPAPPDQRPTPMDGPRTDEGIRYLERLDRLLDDAEAMQGNWRARCMQVLENFLRRTDGMSANDFVDRVSWVMMHVQENRSWSTEIVRMARERFEQQAHADKPYLKYRRPSSAWE